MEHERPMKAALKLRKLRKSRKITLNELGAMCGLDQSTLSRIETGKRSFFVKDLIVICRALEIEPSDLLDGDHGSS